MNNLIGQRFGKLIVTNYNKEKKKWVCQCDCGEITEVGSTNLKTGNTKSCGCGRNGKGIKKNRRIRIVNQNIGQLYVEKILEDNKDFAECKCLKCGKTVKMPVAKLIEMKKTRKKTFTCGKNGCSYNKGTKKSNGIQKGVRFGNLVVLERIENKIIKTQKSTSSIPMYHCQCDCGNEIEVQGRYLLDGRTQSCGCLKEKNFNIKHRYQEIPDSDIKQELYKIFQKWRQKYRQPTELFKRKVIDKGIKFFPEMKDEPFEKFYWWANLNGFNLSEGKIYLDRKDYSKDFSNKNCFWTDKKTKGY